MILIDEPYEPSIRVSLNPEKVRTVRGKPALKVGGKASGSWIDLSPVTAVPLAAKMTDDAELANFITAEEAGTVT